MIYGGKMACGCNKGGGAHNYRSRPIMRSNIGNRGNIVAGTTPAQIRNNSMTPQSPRNSGGISSEQRKTQALRRDAIRKALNK